MIFGILCRSIWRADKFESQMRLSPNRQKLLKQRNFILEQQGNMKKLEADVAVMQDRLEAVGRRGQAPRGRTCGNCGAVARQSSRRRGRERPAAPKLPSIWPRTLARYEQGIGSKCAKTPRPATVSRRKSACAPPRPNRSTTNSAGLRPGIQARFAKIGADAGKY